MELSVMIAALPQISQIAGSNSFVTIL